MKVNETICRVIWLMLGLFYSCVGVAQDDMPKERKLKAAYLVNFTKYMSWPQSVDIDPNEPFKLCINSDDAFFNFSKALVARHNEGSGVRKIRISRINEVDDCQMVYFQMPILEPLVQIEHAVIVLESKQVEQEKSAIRFYTEEQRVRFEVDLTQLARVNVVVSSELLKLARIAR